MKKWNVLIIILAASMLLAACGPKTTEPTPVVENIRPSGVIAEGRLFPVLAQDQAFILSGRVADVLVQDGASMEKGDVLARLETSPESLSALARAEQEQEGASQALADLKAGSGLALAQAELKALQARQDQESAQDRYDANDSEENLAELNQANALAAQAEDELAKLQDNDGVDPDALKLAEARLKSADTALASARALVDAHELKASMGGTLVDFDLAAGQLVASGQSVAAIADYSAWIIETDNLTEADVVQVKIGQKVQVSLDALPDAVLEGEVTHINARYEEKRGDITYTVTVKLNQADPNMRWGMTAAVVFVP